MTYFATNSKRARLRDASTDTTTLEEDGVGLAAGWDSHGVDGQGKGGEEGKEEGIHCGIAEGKGMSVCALNDGMC